MKLKLIKDYNLSVTEKTSYERIILFNNQCIVALLSKDYKYYLQWITADTITEELVFTGDYMQNPPVLFRCEDYIGYIIHQQNKMFLYKEADKPYEVNINNTLPPIRYPDFERELLPYRYAGNSNSNVVPFLLGDCSSLPNYIAFLQIDFQAMTASWTSQIYWNGKNTIPASAEYFEKPVKRPFTMLHAMLNNSKLYAYAIGDRSSGYLKYGMDYSELSVLDENGSIDENLFSLGRLYKADKKGGKECLFTSSLEYAILTPVYKSDDWKNKQKLFNINNRQLHDITLSKGYTKYRIIDHIGNTFLLADRVDNLLLSWMQNLITCEIDV